MAIENKQLVEAVIHAFHTPDAAERLRALVTPDYQHHGPRAPEPKNLDVVLVDAASMFEGFPDLVPDIQLQLAEDDLVATRLVWRGTHTGDYVGVAPTGESVEIEVNRIDRVVDGRLAESWVEFDPMVTLIQIGVVDSLPHLDE